MLTTSCWVMSALQLYASHLPSCFSSESEPCCVITMEVPWVSTDAICRTGLSLGVNECLQVPLRVLSGLLCQVIDNWAHCQDAEYPLFPATVVTLGAGSILSFEGTWL